MTRTWEHEDGRTLTASVGDYSTECSAPIRTGERSKKWRRDADPQEPGGWAT